MKHKTAFLSTITIILTFVVIGPALFVYIVDPFQIYHKSFFKEAKYSTEQSYQHAGWINQLLADPENNYQAIVIGPSTMANYTQTLINKHLAWGNTMNLSVNGSTPSMQHSIAQYALKKNPRIKHILWDVHAFYAFDAGVLDNKTQLQFPHYLYNEKIWDDKPYLFNVTNIQTGIDFLRGDFSKFSANIEDNGPFYESLHIQDRFNINASQDNRKNALLPQLVDLDRTMPNDPNLKTNFSSIDVYMLDVLLPLCNSDSDIKIIFSPTERFNYATTADIHYLYRQLFMRRYVVNKTEHCKNIRVFAFDNIDWIVNDLRNFADNYHYQIGINDYIMESIVKNENQLTTGNINEYETTFIRNINGYKKIFLSELTP